MMIRAYRMRGHLHADLDPLGLEPLKDHEELHPSSYGFTDADLDRKIFIDGMLGLEFSTLREMLAILRRTYCATIGYEFMHISDPEQKAWIRSASRGRARTLRSPARVSGPFSTSWSRSKAMSVTSTRSSPAPSALASMAPKPPFRRSKKSYRARRGSRRHRCRARHGPSRPSQRPQPGHAQAASRHLSRVQGRLVRPGRSRGLGRRQISPGRVLRPRVRWAQGASVADRQSVASGNLRPGRARQGSRQAGSERRHRRPHQACCRC